MNSHIWSKTKPRLYVCPIYSKLVCHGLLGKQADNHIKGALKAVFVQNWFGSRVLAFVSIVKSQNDIFAVPTVTDTTVWSIVILIVLATIIIII